MKALSHTQMGWVCAALFLVALWPAAVMFACLLECVVWLSRQPNDWGLWIRALIPVAYLASLAGANKRTLKRERWFKFWLGTSLAAGAGVWWVAADLFFEAWWEVGLWMLLIGIGVLPFAQVWAHRKWALAKEREFGGGTVGVPKSGEDREPVVPDRTLG